MIKQIMIPVAAFAITATSAAAFGSADWSELDVDLTDSQISALEEAHELRQTAGEEAKQVLTDAGIDEEKIKEIKEAQHDLRNEKQTAVRDAIESEDYDAYLLAVAGSPQAELITSEDDFDKLVEASELRAAGDMEGAAEIMSDLGFEQHEGRGGRGSEEGGKRGGFGGPGSRGDRQSAEA